MAGAESDSHEFLWVNKTIHSSALSNNKGDAARIRSVNKHVQRWRTKSANATRQPPAEPDALSVGGWRLDGHQRHRKAVQRNATAEEAAEEVPASNYISTVLATVPPTWGSPIDPFKTSSVPMTSEVFGFLRYFTESFLSAAIQTMVQNALNPKKAPSFQHVGSLKIVQECVADERHMYSVLALTSHQIKYLIGHKLPRMDRPEFYMSKALKGLRKTFDGDELAAMSQQVILDFAWMATAEAYRGNFVGAMVHHRINLYVVEKMGGFGTVDPFVKEMCRIGDIFVSSVTLIPPIFGLAEDPGPISEAFRAEINRRILPPRRMGIGFSQHEDLWDLSMSDVVDDLLSLVQAAQYLWAFPDAEVSSDDRDWVLQRSHGLTHKLLSMVPTSPLVTLEQAIQEVCRQSFVLWLFYVLAGTAGIPSEPGGLKRVRNMMPEHTRQLRKAIEFADSIDENDTRWGQHDQLLLWVLAFGTLTFKTDGCWFALELRADCKARGIYTYDSLAVITSTFLSLDRLEQLSNRKLARTLIAGMMED